MVVKYNRMPKVDVVALKEKLSEDELEFVKDILKPDNTIRASKPNSDGLTQYIWRLVVFQVSPHYQHQCMPLGAFFYIPGKYGTPEFEFSYRLGNKIAEAIVDCVSKTEWHGIRRWAEVL